MTKFRVESRMGVGQVDVEKGVIVKAPPIWQIFKGQEFIELLNWLLKHTKHVSITGIPD